MIDMVIEINVNYFLAKSNNNKLRKTCRCGQYCRCNGPLKKSVGRREGRSEL